MKRPKASNMPGSSSSLDGSVADSESLDHLTSQMGGVSLNNEPAPAPPRVKSHPYFRTHRGFNYDPKQSDFVNFGRLASKYKWSAGGRPWKTEWLKCFPESWNVTRKAQGFTGASIIEFFAFFAFDHYESDYNSFVDEHAKVKGWSVGSDGWRRKWLKIVGYPYVKSSITDGANAEIEAVRNEAALQIRYNAESACLPTALPIRNPNQYFEAHRSAAFVPDYNKAFSSDFANLAQVKKWKVKSSQYKQEKQKAFDEEFNRWFDLCPSQDQILQILQALCLEIDVEVGESIRKCKKDLKGANINLINFVDWKRGHDELKKFNNPAALSRYIREDRANRVMSKAEAKKQVIYRVFMQHVLNHKGRN